MEYEPPETFTDEERRALAPHFTNLDGPVFALVNLPEVVKGALFARYSRSAKSLRRLFLDEFLGDVAAADAGGPGEAARAEKLYETVFLEYGDDSVAQLGGVHLACEGASNVLTKILEWGRLMAYLEQSTRYVPYTQKPNGRWKYVVPPEVEQAGLGGRYRETLDFAFETYASSLQAVRAHLESVHPHAEGVSPDVWRRTIRAKALDTTRGLLPAATRSNVGIYGTGQAWEALLLRMRAHPLGEVREYADLMLVELRKVIPAFLARVDRPDRGGAWSDYLRSTREATEAAAREILAGEAPGDVPEVTLTDFDPDGEIKVVAAALYAVGDLPDARLAEIARGLSPTERERVLRAYVGERGNRRHKPGRAFERTSYRFDVLSDYGAFRDLQRHRMLTIEWQRLGTDHGFALPPGIEAAGLADAYREVMDRAKALHDAIREAAGADAAAYAVPMAYRLRYYLEMNAREAIHLIELRSAPQGHAVYRRIAREMHRLIAEEAGHRGIAAAMEYVHHGEVELERLEAERRTEARRKGAS